jgi:hypothetical protein
MRFLAPAYVHAQAGVAKLGSSKTLLPGDDGFSELAKLFFDTASHENSAEVLALLSVKGFTRQTAMIALGEDHAGEVVPVEVELSNGQKVRWDLKQIESQLDSLKGNRVFDYTLVFFAVGTVLEIVGFIIERHGTHESREI